MVKVRICQDLDESERLWSKNWPKERIFDCWTARSCFQKAFNNSPFFIVAEQNGVLKGMLALSWIKEEQCFGHFPGETWQGKTWLEQNRIIAKNANVVKELLDQIPDEAHIRYLVKRSVFPSKERPMVDETGYLFLPEQYGYSFHRYMEQFPGKSRKKIRKELEKLEAHGVSYRYNCLSDMEHLFKMNLDAFGTRSYFKDYRFLKSFKNLADWLHKNGMLRITTVILGGRVAAVDIGSVWKSTYTVMAGGTAPEFPGVAKLINLHHMEWACTSKLGMVDFLCGDFGWKERFRLTPRPLYKLQIGATQEICQKTADKEVMAASAF